MTRMIALLFCAVFTFHVQAQLNMSLVGQIDYPFNTNDIWGYTADNGDEYALVGTRRGLSIVDLNRDTLEEVAFLDGSNSTWRDIKTWDHYAYVATEAADGLMIADLSYLPDSVPFRFWQPSIERPMQAGVLDTLLTIHNIFVDEFGLLQIAGSNVHNGGVIFADLTPDPSQPEVVALGPPVYSHDAYARDSILYSSEIYAGKLGIYDYSDLDNITLVATQQTPLLFTHNAWLSDNSKYVFTTDERGNAPVTSYDISDFSDIRELDRYIPAETAGQGVVPHNVHVWNDWLVISYYTDGGKIVDASRPDNLVEVGNFDTFFDSDPGFGAWGAYPYLPSGRILITDSGNGLFVLEPNYVRAAFLEGKVEGLVNAGREDEEIIPLVNARVTITEAGEPLLPAATKGGGFYKTGKAIPGSYLVEISADGFISWKDTVEFENGTITTLNVILDESTTTALEPDPELGRDILAYPNPVSSMLTIDLTQTQRKVDMIRVFDTSGRLMMQRPVSADAEFLALPTGDWPTGMYLFQFLDTKGFTATKRIQVLR